MHRQQRRAASGRCFRSSQIAGFTRDLLWVDGGKPGKGLINLADAHPPQSLTHIHQSLTGLPVLQQLAALAEDLFAKLVHAHATIVQGCGAFDALRRLTIAPAQDHLHRIEPTTTRRHGLLELRRLGCIVFGAEHCAVLPASVLPGCSAQELNPLALRCGDNGRNQQQTSSAVHVRVVHAVVGSSATAPVCDRHTPGLVSTTATTERHRGSIQILLPLLWLRLVERARQRAHGILAGPTEAP
mmetsp:Transcript_39272/g.92036  ORF Transcript_39272/g.92036 Transcript_39272/m.92036 type:complete len:242 (-) Transcript_39272:1981-2706(-)